MRSRILKTSRARMVALAVSAGAASLLATAPSALAVGAAPKPPAVGSNCQTDGKISGAGSTFQGNGMLNGVVYGYQQDVCGPVGNATNLNSSWGSTDPAEYTATLNKGTSQSTTKAVGGMVAYNYTLSGTGAKNGSGAGINRMSCRTDMFGGTDLPYNDTQLTGLNGAPGATTSSCQTSLNLTAVPPPYYSAAGSSYPNTSDSSTSNVMSFPLAGGAVAVAVNLAGMCTNGTPTGLNLTAQEFDYIEQGKINQWNDPALVATNPILTTDVCSGNITRVVRLDSSGTTSLVIGTLGAGSNGTQGIDQGTICDGNTWTTYYNYNSLNPTPFVPASDWPEGCKDGANNTAPNVLPADATGSGSLITKVEATNGSIGYAELGLWSGLPAGTSLVNIESHDAQGTYGNSNTPPSSVFISPGAPGAKSACNPGARGLPGSTANAAVGLGGTGSNWSNSATAPPTGTNVQNISWAGPGYPVCGLTFDMVYTGMDNESGEVAGSGGTAGCTGSSVITGSCQTQAGPEIGTTNDQLRTLYSFWTYVFTPLGQSYLAQTTLDPLPGSWLPLLQSGFQNNF